MENLAGRLSGQTVFVTGGTGFVGGWLVHALLEAGVTVVSLVRDLDPRSEYARAKLHERVITVAGDLYDFKVLQRAVVDYEPAVIFHLGAQTLVGNALISPLETFESNIRGTYNLLEAARRSGLDTTIVVASSDKAYGSLTADRYVESMALAGEHPYDVSKSCTDLLARTYWRTYGMPVTIARCGNVYGGGDINWSRLVPGTIRSFLERKRPVIRSDGSLVRDYLHVRDVVDAYMSLALAARREGVSGEAFNFSAGDERTVLQVVAELQRIMGTDLEPDVRNEARAEIHTQVLDYQKAQRVLDWHPKMDFDAGLREAVEWYSALLVHDIALLKT